MEIKFFKTKKNFKKKNLELNPDFFWKLIVLLVFILILFSFVFGYYLFTESRKDPIFSLEDINKKQAPEIEKTKKVLEYFSTQDKKSLEILNSPSPVVDPSL